MVTVVLGLAGMARATSDVAATASVVVGPPLLDKAASWALVPAATSLVAVNPQLAPASDSRLYPWSATFPAHKATALPEMMEPATLSELPELALKSAGVELAALSTVVRLSVMTPAPPLSPLSMALPFP